MPAITDFEDFLLPAGQAKHHVYRRGEVLLSLPRDPNGAIHALRLYQPQRPLARFTTFCLRILAHEGWHQKFLLKGKQVSHESFPDWEFPYDPLTVGIMLGSTEHRVTRAIASFQGANGWEVAKLGSGEEARTMLRKEAEILRAVYEKGMNAPRCLGLHEKGDMTVLRMPYLIGTGLTQDACVAALDLLKKWISGSPGKSVFEFQEWNSVRSALSKSQEGKKVLASFPDHTLVPVISHGDFARWNLVHVPDGSLIALDWEWGNMAGMPGLDLVHYFAQDARLVRRLPPGEVIRHVESKLAEPGPRSYLQSTGWSGNLLEPILACVAYKQGVRHQKNPELLEACVSKYLEISSKAAPPKLSASDSETKFPVTRFSIITPSYNQVEFLKCCAASVADQQGDIEVEHLIHDGGSGSDFDAWAAGPISAICVSEKDDGMYDAINRGFRKATGDIIAWLNCDEQYLPGTLDAVARFFAENPETDIVFGDLLLVDEVMTPLAYRRAVKPTLGHIRHSHLSTFSAATFVRRRVLDEGHYLQSRWKTIADAVWIDELLSAGYKTATLRMPLASFCMLGSNLGQSALLFEERKIWEKETGSTGPWRKRWHILEYRLERLRVGAYSMRKARASCYLLSNNHRTTQERWVSGQWSVARDEAAKLRSQREGMMGGLGLNARLRRTLPSFLHAAAVMAISIHIDGLAVGDAVKGPSFLLFSLLYLSFRSRLRDLIPVACAYFFVSWYLLSERPHDVLVTRLATFSFGGILAVFWAASLRNLEEWIRSTVTLIRRMGEPILLTDRTGRVILVNHQACSILGSAESSYMGRKLLPLDLSNDGSVTGRLDIFHQDQISSERVMALALEGSNGSLLARARASVVGKGRFRVYAFTLDGSDRA